MSNVDITKLDKEQRIKFYNHHENLVYENLLNLAKDVNYSISDFSTETYTLDYDALIFDCRWQWKDGSSIDFVGSTYSWLYATSFSVLSLQAGIEKDEPDE